MPSIICCSHSTLCRYQYTAKIIMLCILMPGLLLPMLALKVSRVEKKQAKKLTTPPKLAPFYNKHLKSTGAKALSASALISNNTVFLSHSCPCISVCVLA